MDGKPITVIEPESKAPLIKAAVNDFVGSIGLVVFAGFFVLMFTDSFTLAVAGAIGVGLVSYGGGMLAAKKKIDNKKYEIYEDRIQETSGVLSTNYTSVQFDDVTDVHYGQSFLENQFDVGHVDLNTAGNNSKAITMKYIPEGEDVYENFQQKLKQK